MKNTFRDGCKGNNFAPKRQFNTFRYDAYIIIGSIIILIGFLFTGCKKERRETAEFEIQQNHQHDEQSGGNVESLLRHYLGEHPGVFNPTNQLIGVH